MCVCRIVDNVTADCGDSFGSLSVYAKLPMSAIHLGLLSTTTRLNCDINTLLAAEFLFIALFSQFGMNPVKRRVASVFLKLNDNKT